jgi:hypothetical protein
MNILALDLGTKTGWALYSDRELTSGTWLLATEKELRQQRKENRDRCCDVRFSRLRELILKLPLLNYIYFEDVQFLTSQAQSQLWAGFRTVVTLMERGELSLAPLKLVAVPVGTLKKFATGNGAAKKELMAAFLQDRVGRSPIGRDDNEIDALHLLNFALTDLTLK